MGIRKIFSRFSCFTRSSAPGYGFSSLNVNPCASVQQTSHDSDNIVTSHVSDDIQSPCSHPSAPLATSDSQPTAPLAVPSTSQPYDSEDVPAVMQNDTPSIARSDAPSSSTSAVPSSSTPSSSSHPSAPLATSDSQPTAPLAAPSTSQPYDSEDVPAVMQNDTPSITRSDAPSSSTSAVPSSSTPSSSSHPSASLATSHSQSTAPLAVPSTSQPYDSEDVPAVMQNDTPSIARSDAPSSSTSAVPSSSNVLKERDHTKKIREDADAVDRGNKEADLAELSKHISQYLAFIKDGGEKPSPVTAAKFDWPGSQFMTKIKEMTSGATETVKVFCPDPKTIAQEFLQGMGGVHMLMTGFLVVGNIMERYEKISSDKEERVLLLERMYELIQEVDQIRDRDELMKAMEKQIRDAIVLIIDVSVACCNQIARSKHIKLFSINKNNKELQGFQKKLTELHRKIHWQMSIVMYDRQGGPPASKPPPQCPRLLSEEFRRQNKGQIEKVTELLKWKSTERAVAVILYGLRGTGKTALADAVYWSLYHEKVLPFRNHEEVLKCKYSYVRLFDSITSAPDIPKLQTQILENLTLQVPNILRHEEGQDAILKALEKEAAFIYIDNVLFPDTVQQGQGRDAIEELLPRITTEVKQLRLLITTRDKGAAVVACHQVGIETKLYPIETLEDAKARQLVEEELNRGEEDHVNEQQNGRDKKLDSNQINQIVQICGGIPQVLIKVAHYIGPSREREEAQEKYKWVISETEKNWNRRPGWDIASYAFDHEGLHEDLKDPFFDICSYFQGWDWEELSNTVGNYELNSLEDRALVTKDVNSMTAKVHNVILAIGIHNKGRRFTFNSASEFQKVLNPKKDKDLCGIKGIWSNHNIGQLDIPAPKLDLMCGSLRVLALENSTEVKGRCNGTFEELCFFSAKISHISFDLSKVKTLRHLCYSTDDLQNLCQMPRNLTSNLRILQLRQCGSIESLPESIGQFNFLDSIDLSSTDLKELPNGFCSLSSLKNLAMDNCQSLEKLPDGFGKLRSLRKLSLSRCVSLKQLPDSFSQLKDLEALNLSGCVNLVQLCIDFKELSSLRVLSLKDCKMLKNLPENFHGLTSLKHLYLSNCVELEVRSMESIVKMETLQTVDIQSSPLLQKAWQNIKEGCNQLSHKVVRTSGQGSSNEENVERNDDMQE